MKTLLICDEDQRIKNIVRYTFESKGFNVIACRTGAEALLKIKKTRPDIALIDVSLFDRSGYEVCKEIKNDSKLKNIPVILLASLFRSFNQGELADARADALISKPFEFDELIRKVEFLASQKEQRAPLPAISKGEVRTIKKMKSLPLTIPMKINTSSTDELEMLPGIGTKLARRIVDWRDLNNGFKSIEDLEKVKGITKKKIEILRPFVKIEQSISYLAVITAIILVSLPSIFVLFVLGEDATPFSLEKARTILSDYVHLTHEPKDTERRWLGTNPIPAEAFAHGMSVTINDRKEILINDNKSTLRELRSEIDRFINSRDKIDYEKVILKADATLPYGAVMEIADEIKEMGVQDLEFIVAPMFMPILSDGEQSKPDGEVESDGFSGTEIKSSENPPKKSRPNDRIIRPESQELHECPVL